MSRRRVMVVGAGILVIGAMGFFLLNPAPPDPVSLDPIANTTTPGALVPETPEGDWVVAGSEDVFVGYRAREMLAFDLMDGGTVSAPHDAVGRTTAVDGGLRIEGGRLMEVQITADLRELRSDRQMRDGHLSVALGFEEMPYAHFELTTPIDLADEHVALCPHPG